MDFLPILGAIVTVVGAILMHNRWLISYIDERDKQSNLELNAQIEALKQSNLKMWTKIDDHHDKLIVLNTLAVNEDKVRLIMEEYRVQFNIENKEIKEVINVALVGLEQLKIANAISEAVNKRGM